MKKLDLFILRTAMVPFLATLVIGNFVFLMQFMYRKLDDIVGKGLGPDVMAELIMHASFTLIPYSLPLSVLIASVMAMGNLGERYELTALKTSGVSLLRIFRPLIFASILMAGVAFFFSNQVMPYSKLKLSVLFYDITKKKPSLLLKEGVFLRDFDNLVMKIDEKKEDGLLEGVLIYDHRKQGQTRIIKAKSGTLQNEDSSRFMLMKLYDGHVYDDKEFKDQYTRFAFQTLDMVIDMSGFEMGQTSEELFLQNAKLKRLDQLSRDMDTIELDLEKRTDLLNEDLSNSFLFYKSEKDTVAISSNWEKEAVQERFKNLEHEEQITALSQARARVRNSKQEVVAAKSDLKYNRKRLLDHRLAWYGKFALAFSCIVLFFVGAPMGALVRKGGFGMPIVVSVVLYVIYHVINSIGNQLAKNEVLTPLLGMWLSTLVLFPLALFLTYKAVQDSRIFNFDSLKTVGNKIAGFFIKKKEV